ncbi:hypothetical protein OXX79_013861 [Metschnikowia pulcherrima]
MNVLICACDTFRSGAVEQLKVHVNNLQRLNSGSASDSRIELFEKGYGGGDHVVNTAKSAIAYAGASNFDIVLIDTAGRTHSNAKLMAPLKNLAMRQTPTRSLWWARRLLGSIPSNRPRISTMLSEIDVASTFSSSLKSTSWVTWSVQ